MHFCADPIEVLHYYPLVTSDGKINEFAEVESLNDVKTIDYKKFCTTKLKIGKKISHQDFLRICANFPSKQNFCKINETDFKEIANFTSFSSIINSGNNVKIANSGAVTSITNFGNATKISDSGTASRIINLGNSTEISCSGNSSIITSLGKDCVICCTGDDPIVRAKKGSWITLTEWKFDLIKKDFILLGSKTAQVDGKNIKEDTFYHLVEGQFIEAEWRNY